MAPIITLTTDFGTTDGYVAAMKGVILSVAPDAVIVDVTHNAPPQDVLHAAYVLSTAAPFFPPGTVHVAVVDPGVGTDRKAIALAAGGHAYVGPDNGIFSLILDPPPSPIPPRASTFAAPVPEGVAAVEIVDTRYRLPHVSATFHGRDVFAPAAAHLSRDVALGEFGPRLSHINCLAIAAPSAAEDGAVLAQIIHVDRFGNAVTNVRRQHLPADVATVEVKEQAIQALTDTYGTGTGLMALWGSAGWLEIALRDGNAAHSLGLTPGDPVLVRLGPANLPL